MSFLKSTPDVSLTSAVSGGRIQGRETSGLPMNSGASETRFVACVISLLEDIACVAQRAGSVDIRMGLYVLGEDVRHQRGSLWTSAAPSERKQLPSFTSVGEHCSTTQRLQAAANGIM